MEVDVTTTTSAAPAAPMTAAAVKNVVVTDVADVSIETAETVGGTATTSPDAKALLMESTDGMETATPKKDAESPGVSLSANLVTATTKAIVPLGVVAKNAVGATDAFTMRFERKTYRRLDWTGEIRFIPNKEQLVATLLCDGINKRASPTVDGTFFLCRVKSVQLRTVGGRFLAVATPDTPFVLTNDADAFINDADEDSRMKIEISAPFSPTSLAKLLHRDMPSSVNCSNDDILIICKKAEVCLDFSIEGVEWYGDWRMGANV